MPRRSKPPVFFTTPTTALHKRFLIFQRPAARQSTPCATVRPFAARQLLLRPLGALFRVPAYLDCFHFQLAMPARRHGFGARSTEREVWIFELSVHNGLRITEFN